MEKRVVTTMAALLWGGDSVLPGGSYLLHLSLLERREGRVLMMVTILLQFTILHYFRLLVCYVLGQGSYSLFSGP